MVMGKRGSGSMSTVRVHERWKQCVLLSFILGAVVMLGSIPELTRADQPVPVSTLGYQSGKITAVYQTTFLIDGRSYRLAPEVVIYDDSGNRIDAGYIGVDLEVRFHVKREQNDMIDTIILYLPR